MDLDAELRKLVNPKNPMPRPLAVGFLRDGGAATKEDNERATAAYYQKRKEGRNSAVEFSGLRGGGVKSVQERIKQQSSVTSKEKKCVNQKSSVRNPKLLSGHVELLILTASEPRALKGDNAFKEGRYVDAVIHYNKAIEVGGLLYVIECTLNQCLALIKLQRLAAESSSDPRRSYILNRWHEVCHAYRCAVSAILLIHGPGDSPSLAKAHFRGAIALRYAVPLDLPL